MGKTVIKMPQIGMTMIAGTITKWFKNDGDQVNEGETLFEFETEKMTNEVPAPTSGTLKIIKQVEAEVNCGEPVAEIE